MKKFTKLLFAGFVFLAMATFFNGRAAQAKEYEHRNKMNAEDHLKKMTKRLGLTPDQQTQVGKLLADKKEKMEAVNKEFHDQLRAILTDDQKKKWDAKEAKEEKGESKQ